MNITVGARTDTGTRDNNEDSYAVLTNNRANLRAEVVLIVADGMGGRAYGERASSSAVDSIRQTLSDLLAVSAPEQPPIPDALKTALRRANSLVYDMAAANPGKQPMGTTCTTAVIAGDQLTIAHVGDSRAYLLRDDILRPITSDHSFVAEQIRAGQLSDHDARRSRFKNVITKAVGIEPTLQPDIETHKLRDGDVVLVCTDGLSGMIDEAGITQIILQSPEAQLACDHLVEAAKRSGGKDNISAIVAYIGEPAFAAARKTDPTIRRTNGGSARRPRPSRDDIERPKAVAPDLASLASVASATAPAKAEAKGETGAQRAERFLSDVDAQPRRPMPPALVPAVLFAVGLIAGAALLAASLAGTHAVRFTSRAPYLAPYEKPQTKPPVIDLASVSYAPPARLLYKPVRPDFVQAVPGGVLAVTTQGRLLLVGPTGQIVRSYTASFSPPPAAPPPAAATAAAGAHAATALPAPVRPLGLTADSQGNIYKSDPAKRAIDKYRPDGTLLQAIDPGALASPGALAVAQNGDLYVIDQGRLALIKAVAPTDTPSAGKGK